MQEANGLCTHCSFGLECMNPRCPHLAYFGLVFRGQLRAHLWEFFFIFPFSPVFGRFLSCLDQRTCHMGLGLLTCLPDRPSAARAEKRDYIFSFQTLRACQHKIYVECMNEPNGKMKLERWWKYVLPSKKAADCSVWPGLKWFLFVVTLTYCFSCVDHYSCKSAM